MPWKWKYGRDAWHPRSCLWRHHCSARRPYRNNSTFISEKLWISTSSPVSQSRTQRNHPCLCVAWQPAQSSCSDIWPELNKRKRETQRKIRAQENMDSSTRWKKKYIYKIHASILLCNQKIHVCFTCNVLTGMFFFVFFCKGQQQLQYMCNSIKDIIFLNDLKAFLCFKRQRRYLTHACC